MMNRRRCVGRNATGGPCGAPPTRESAYCYFHDPEFAEARENARHLGHARQRRDATLATIYGFTSLSTTEGKQQLMDIAAHDTLALDNTVARNRALAGYVQISIKVDEYTELRGRLEALEAAVKAHRDDHDSVYDEADDVADPFPRASA